MTLCVKAFKQTSLDLLMLSHDVEIRTGSLEAGRLTDGEKMMRG